MNWILIIVLCIILIEFIIHIPFIDVILEIIVVAQKAQHILRAKSVSDHWKEKVMLVYAGMLFVSTVKLAAFLVLLGIFAMMLILSIDYFGAKIGDLIITWLSILYSIIIATIYLQIRKLFFV